MRKLNLTFSFLVSMLLAPLILSAEDLSADNDARLIHSVSPVFPTDIPNISEGWIEIQFDINEMGMPMNLVVIKSEPEKVFNRSAIRAIVQWRYIPAYKDGAPIVQNNNTVRLEFKIDE